MIDVKKKIYKTFCSGECIDFGELCIALGSVADGYAWAKMLVNDGIVSEIDGELKLNDDKKEEFKALCDIIGDFLEDEQIAYLGKTLNSDQVAILDYLRRDTLDISQPVMKLKAEYIIKFDLKYNLQGLLSYNLIKIEGSIVKTNLSISYVDEIVRIHSLKLADIKKAFFPKIMLGLRGGRFSNCTQAFSDYIDFGDIAFKDCVQKFVPLSEKDFKVDRKQVLSDELPSYTEEQVETYKAEHAKRLEENKKLIRGFDINVTLVNEDEEEVVVKVNSNDTVEAVFKKLFEMKINKKFFQATEKPYSLMKGIKQNKCLFMRLNGSDYLLEYSTKLFQPIDFYYFNAMVNNNLRFYFKYV